MGLLQQTNVLSEESPKDLGGPPVGMPHATPFSPDLHQRSDKSN